MNKICTKSFRNAIGIGARAFRSDYEGGVILLRRGKGWETQSTITPPYKNPPQQSQIIRGGWGGFLLGGGDYVIIYIIYIYIYIHIIHITISGLVGSR